MVVRRALLAAALVPAVLLALPGSAAAHNGTRDRRPAAIISLGDSFISGMAGRWLGNSTDATGDRRGTDRAYAAPPAQPMYDPTRIYGATAATGCYRSDVAEIHQVRMPHVKTINIACSGADAVNVLRARAGGQVYKGEAPQNDQLALLARAYRIKAVVVSIGGNDLAFSRTLTNCVVKYVTGAGPCAAEEQPKVAALVEPMRAIVGRTIDDLRAVMSEAGYGRRSYRLIVQSYPMPQAPPDEHRYPENNERLIGPGDGGCPLYDKDITFGRDHLVGQLSDVLRGIARERRAQFLDLKGAFRGHELCSARARHSLTVPSEATSEWVRWIKLDEQSSRDEALHPNAYGQKALGRCLTLALYWHRDAACYAVPGRSTAALYLRPLR
jgi:hypothetical protein